MPASGGRKITLASHWYRSKRKAATELGVDIGDRFVFFIAGREVEVRIASFQARELGTPSSQTFFMVFSPQALQGLPSTFITSLKAGDEHSDTLLQLVRATPDGIRY